MPRCCTGGHVFDALVTGRVPALRAALRARLPDDLSREPHADRLVHLLAGEFSAEVRRVLRQPRHQPARIEYQRRMLSALRDGLSAAAAPERELAAQLDRAQADSDLQSGDLERAESLYRTLLRPGEPVGARRIAALELRQMDAVVPGRPGVAAMAELPESAG